MKVRNTQFLFKQGNLSYKNRQILPVFMLFRAKITSWQEHRTQKHRYETKIDILTYIQQL